MISICSKVGFAQGSIGAAADFFLAFYPVHIIGRLQQMKLSTKTGLCLIMGGGLIAGIGGINKTIAIASITHVQDLTCAVYKLDIWVLTEMWFIIIFGSISVLHPFFIRFTQDIKSATGHATSRSNRRGYVSESRDRRDSWVQLNDHSHETCVTHGFVQSTTSRGSVNADRSDDCETPEQQIVATKDITVVSEERF